MCPKPLAENRYAYRTMCQVLLLKAATSASSTSTTSSTDSQPFRCCCSRLQNIDRFGTQVVVVVVVVVVASHQLSNSTTTTGCSQNMVCAALQLFIFKNNNSDGVDEHGYKYHYHGSSECATTPRFGVPGTNHEAYK